MIDYETICRARNVVGNEDAISAFLTTRRIDEIGLRHAAEMYAAAAPELPADEASAFMSGFTIGVAAKEIDDARS